MDDGSPLISSWRTTATGLFEAAGRRSSLLHFFSGWPGWPRWIDGQSFRGIVLSAACVNYTGSEEGWKCGSEDPRPQYQDLLDEQLFKRDSLRQGRLETGSVADFSGDRSPRRLPSSGLCLHRRPSRRESLRGSLCRSRGRRGFLSDSCRGYESAAPPPAVRCS